MAKVPGLVAGWLRQVTQPPFIAGPLGNIIPAKLITDKITDMKKRTLKFLGFGLIAIIYIAIAQVFGNKRDKRNFNKFYNSEIRGSVKKVEIKYHGVGFRVHNDSTEYVFYPYTSLINQKKIFYNFATKGDSVVKPRYQDTLILIKEGRKYLYTFRKD